VLTSLGKKLLNNEVLIDRFPRRIPRCYYAFNQKVVTDWKDRIPPGFALNRVDENLLKSNLDNIDTLIVGIKDIIASVDEFIRRRFEGYCLVYRDKAAVGWCLSFRYGSSCEFTVQTAEEYQQRGFGTITTAALIDSCLSSNHGSIGWHCGQENVPSMKLAEKVGFERTDHDYSWMYGNLVD
jgi:GNAT superfamily N-acetyltransferase